MSDQQNIKYSYIAFLAGKPYGDHVVLTDYSEWSKIYDNDLKREVYYINKKIISTLYYKAVGSTCQNEGYTVFLAIPHPSVLHTNEFEIYDDYWVAPRVALIEEVRDPHAAATLILESHKAGYPQLKAVLDWARYLLTENVPPRIIERDGKEVLHASFLAFVENGSRPWQEVYLPDLQRTVKVRDNVEATRIKKRFGWKAPLIVAPYPGTDLILKRDSWFAKRAFLVGPLTSLEESIQMILDSKRAGFPQVDAIASWAARNAKDLPYFDPQIDPGDLDPDIFIALHLPLRRFIYNMAGAYNVPIRVVDGRSSPPISRENKIFVGREWDVLQNAMREARFLSPNIGPEERQKRCVIDREGLSRVCGAIHRFGKPLSVSAKLQPPNEDLPLSDDFNKSLEKAFVEWLNNCYLKSDYGKKYKSFKVKISFSERPSLSSRIRRTELYNGYYESCESLNLVLPYHWIKDVFRSGLAVINDRITLNIAQSDEKKKIYRATWLESVGGRMKAVDGFIIDTGDQFIHTTSVQEAIKTYKKNYPDCNLYPIIQISRFK